MNDLMVDVGLSIPFYTSGIAPPLTWAASFFARSACEEKSVYEKQS